MEKCLIIPAASMLVFLCGCSVRQENISESEMTVTAVSTALTAETTAETIPETTTLTQITTPAEAQTTAESVTVTAQPETVPPVITEQTASADTPDEAVLYTEELNTEDAEWALLLVNPEHPIGEYIPPELTTLSNGVQIDTRIYPALQAMYDAMYAFGYAPFTREDFRTFEDQQAIMETRIARHMAEGYTAEGAKAQAEKYVAAPGKSEHQTGLAVDINASDGNTWPMYNWLSQHAYEYGFIMRYPQGSESITGYQYEPWHYRYVGKEAAAEITGKGITLEEYLS